MDSTEREDLDALLRSPGWARFQQYVAREWGGDEGGGLRFLNGVRQAMSTEAATEQLRQIIVAQREIQTVMAWAARRLAELSKPDLAASGSRRGAL